MRQIILIATATLFFGNVWAQCPTGSFDTQAEIDAFSTNYPNCTALSSLTIEGADITNLDGLSQLTRIGAWGNGLVIQNCSNLTSIAGLSNVDDLGNLNITNNDMLTSLDGLENVRYIDGCIDIAGNQNLSDIYALNNFEFSYSDYYDYFCLRSEEDPFGDAPIDHYYKVHIHGNPALTDCVLQSFCNLSFWDWGYYDFYGNGGAGCSWSSLSSTCGGSYCISSVVLENQEAVDNFLIDYPLCSDSILASLIIGPASGTSDITDLSPLSQISYVERDLTIRNNSLLISLNGLNNIVLGENEIMTNGQIYVDNNDALLNLNALNISKATVISITDNALLTSLFTPTTFDDLAFWLTIENNASLTNITGFENIESLRRLSIRGNSVLSSLAGIQNVHPTQDLFIISNPQLVVCGQTGICGYLEEGGTNSISGNASGCSSSAEIIASCTGVPVNCPTGSISFSTQQEIDDFPVNYPGCTTIPGDIIIDGIGNINNFNGFSQIVNIEGSLYVEFTNVLIDFSGLENLTSVGGNLFIGINEQLTSLTGLENLTSIGGNLFIDSNEQLSSLTGLENLTSVGGDFEILYAYNLTDISNLQSLSFVGGDLTIYDTYIISMEGLNNLNSVGEDIDISSNENLITLAGLGNLNSVGGNVSISNNDILTTLTGLDNLTSIGGYLKIDDNDALTTLTGVENIDPNSITNLILNENPGLAVCNQASVCAYLENGGTSTISGNAMGCNTQSQITNTCSGTNPTCPTGDLTLTTQQEVDDFANIPNCTSIPGKLIIRGDTPTSITNLDGLSQLTSLGNGLLIDGNAITNLNGLQNLTTTGNNLVITNNPNLTSLAGLENITSTTSHLKIENNDSLTDLTGLDGITSVGESMLIFDNDALQDFSGLDNLTSIGIQLYVENNPALTDFSGLENLSSIGTDIRLYGNNVLDNITALSNVISVGGYIRVSEHNTLTSLDGLENIGYNSITNLILTNNTNLAVCSQESICSYLENGGTATINNNASGCNTQAEIEIDCVSSCASLLTIIGVNSQTIPDGIYRAADEVNSTGIVPTDGDVNFKAAQTILLDGNFTVEPNADFSAEIKGCTGQ